MTRRMSQEQRSTSKNSTDNKVVNGPPAMLNEVHDANYSSFNIDNFLSKGNEKRPRQTSDLL